MFFLCNTNNHIEISISSQMDHISTQTDRMVDIATKTIQAAETEDAIGGGADLEGDPELKEEVEFVKTKTYEIKKLTPQLLQAAEMASRQPVGSASSEHLHLVSQEWATKVMAGQGQCEVGGVQ